MRNPRATSWFVTGRVNPGRGRHRHGDVESPLGGTLQCLESACLSKIHGVCMQGGGRSIAFLPQQSSPVLLGCSYADGGARLVVPEPFWG
jgi:hypothetical protein